MDKTTLAAVGQILKELKSDFKGDIKGLEDRLGDSGLIPKITAAKLDAQADAIIRYTEDMQFKRSKVTAGDQNAAPTYIKRLGA